MTVAQTATQEQQLRWYIEQLAHAYLAKWQFQRLEPDSPADTLVADDGMISTSPYVEALTRYAPKPVITDLPHQPSPGSFRGMVKQALAGNIQTIKFHGTLVYVTPQMRLSEGAAQQNTTAALRARSRTSIE